MAKGVKLLLTESVEALGIVGDVVNVRLGYARNYLLPRNMATTPSEEKVKALSAKRADAQRELAALRAQREELIKKLEGVEVELVRSCNDQGILYGAITQQDISTALNTKGYSVKPRDVRLTQVIKRVDHFDVHVKLDSDLDATVRVNVKADRKLDVEKVKEEEAAAAAYAAAAEGAGGEKPEAHGGGKPEGRPEAKGKKPEEKPAKKRDAGEAKDAGAAEKTERAEKPERAEKGEKKPKGKKDGGKDEGKAAPKDTKGTFAKPEANQQFDFGIKRPRRKDRE